MLHFLDWLDYSDISQTAEAIKQFYFGDREIGFETAKDFVNVSFNLLYRSASNHPIIWLRTSYSFSTRYKPPLLLFHE